LETRETTITITVDGREIVCEPGELVIAAARRAGIYIPHFCWHPRMDPVGACRMCLVHVEGGPPKPQTSCTMQVRDGLVVQTQFTNPEIRDAQEGVIEFLLINHPLDCPICDRGGECPLQDQTQDYGSDETRFIEPKRRFPKPVPISPLVNLDRERCILCYRCTRFCDEISGDKMIDTMQRGARAYIYPFPGESFDSYFSGNTIEICPVGALTSAPYRFQARPWDLHQTASVCDLCACGCNVNLAVRVADGQLVRASQFTNEDVNEEWLCDKGRFGHAYVSEPSRITQPWVRRDGELTAVSWDEALKFLGDRLGPLVERGDPDAAALLVGGSLCDEDAYAAQKFARLVLRTNSVDFRLDGGMSVEAPTTPQLTYDDLLGAGHVVLVSLDAREELPIVFLRLRTAATKHGLGVSFVHPRRIAGGDFVRGHLQPLPGTEAIVGAALTAALGQPVAGGLEALASGCGLAPGEVSGFAAALRESARSVIVLGPRLAADPEAVRAWRAVAEVLGARVGWAPRRSGEYGALRSGAHPELLPGWRRVDDASDRAELSAAWGAEVPDAPGASAVDVLRRAASGALEVLWLAGADVLDTPDSRLGAQALYGARFVVLQDVQADDQVEFADVILPAAAFAERDGTLTNWEGRRQTIHKAVDPPGSARADYAIFGEAARRLGRPIGCRRLADVRGELDALLDREAPPFGGGESRVQARVPSGDPDLKLRLLTYRLLYDQGSRVRHTQAIGALTPAGFAEINPADAEAAGVADGAAVRVRTRHGAIVVPARVTTDIRPGVVFVPYAQPGVGARELLSVDDQAPAAAVEPA